VSPSQCAPNLAGNPAADAGARPGKKAADPFIVCFFDRMLASSILGDKFHGGSDKPLRPSLVGADEPRIERDQKLQFLAIRDSARQIVALKTADIAIANLALGAHVADEFLKLSINHR
jgi:hypothetical protein